MRSVYYRSDDEGHAGRLVWAIAGSIAVNEIILGVIAAFALFREPAPPPDAAAAQTVQIIVVRRPTPPPTPVPSPQSTPTPRLEVTEKQYNPARPRAASTPALRQGGAPAPKPPVLTTTPPDIHASTAAPQQIVGQANAGSGSGSARGAGAGGAGAADSGSGGNGTQGGLDAPMSPCGQAWFDLIRSVPNDDGSVYVEVSMRVMLRNGHEASDPLHWFFYYAHAADNPFLPTHSNERVRLQFPPSGYDLAAHQNPAIVMAIQHTRPNGTSSLPDCPPSSVSQH